MLYYLYMPNNITKKQLKDFLKTHPIMSIAVQGDEVPISSVILYTVDDNWRFFFATAPESYKGKALQKHDKISFNVFEFDIMLVQGTGTVKQIKDEKEIDTILDNLVEATEQLHHFWPPILSTADHKYAVYEITPTWLRSLDLSSPKIREHKPKFTEFDLP